MNSDLVPVQFGSLSSNVYYERENQFRRDSVRITTTGGVTRPQLSSDLGGGQSTLSKWGQQHQHVDLMSGLHDDVEKKNTPSQKSSPSAQGEGSAKKTQQSSDRQGIA